MELKIYQKKVVEDLKDFLNTLRLTNDIEKAYTDYWQRRDILVGAGYLTPYQMIIPRVPHICFKVPTGGGKTFLACNVIKPVFDALPPPPAKVVVWLVPSDSILEQTIKALSEPNHPYRQKINIDFSGRVEVYTKEQLLNGQNFSPTTVKEQLSILVLSYDSFRSAKKEGRKAYQENGNLATFPKVLGTAEQVIEGADETSLIQIINQLSPLVIVDESHHARSSLSVEMLRNFNPSFVIDLTATPKKESNIISFVEAKVLKKENMVKLPVIVYNRHDQTEVLAEAISMQKILEEYAKKEQSVTGRYVRPIVLFQAQPKNQKNKDTFQKIKEKLLKIGIHEKQIAIKTSEINDLKNINLFSEKCPIRYIITINALKEGWDCSFAYILATLANRSSNVEVEQIVGRVLRQPYSKKFNNQLLNNSYVLTSSENFKNTLDRIVKGLNDAGFSERDYFAMDLPESSEEPVIQSTDKPPMLPFFDRQQDEVDEFSLVSEELVKQRVKQLTEATQDNSNLKAMIDQALIKGEEYEKAIEKFDKNDVPSELKSKMNTFEMQTSFEVEALSIEIPQFFLKTERNILSGTEAGFELLERENLTRGFTLTGKDYQIDWEGVGGEMYAVDINEASVPKYTMLNENEINFFRDNFSNLTQERKINTCKDIIFKKFNQKNYLSHRELKAYIGRIIDEMNSEQIEALQKDPFHFIDKINSKIESLLEEYRMSQFSDSLTLGNIICNPSYKFPKTISPTSYNNNISKSLYSSEADINKFEFEIISKISSQNNVKWWHRNIEKKGFFINGFMNHYPDFIIRTNNGNTLLVEPKGAFLENIDTKRKRFLGEKWSDKAGPLFHYFMIFSDIDPDGDLNNTACTINKFLSLLKSF